jgi:hypothetical protein
MANELESLLEDMLVEFFAMRQLEVERSEIAILTGHCSRSGPSYEEKET